MEKAAPRSFEVAALLYQLSRDSESSASQTPVKYFWDDSSKVFLRGLVTWSSRARTARENQNGFTVAPDGIIIALVIWAILIWLIIDNRHKYLPLIK
ncbi:MAG: hypothetical protein EOO38_27225 [Cytophagaceae bacterium]|nr:MAG: hypothetical protein EOO38_27225 [Cytophagaceae bacterium]